MAPVRIGIIGVGNIATLNVPGYLEHEHCDVVALCDPRREVLERRGKEWSVDRMHDLARDLLADDDIDAVEILSPTPLHAEHVIAALAPGSTYRVRNRSRTPSPTDGAWWTPLAHAGLTFRVTEQCCHYPPLRRRVT